MTDGSRAFHRQAGVERVGNLAVGRGGRASALRILQLGHIDDGLALAAAVHQELFLLRDVRACGVHVDRVQRLARGP